MHSIPRQFSTCFQVTEMYGFVKKVPFKKVVDFFSLSLLKIKLTSHQAHLWDNLAKVLRMLTSFLKISAPSIMNIRNTILCQNAG